MTNDRSLQQRRHRTDAQSSSRLPALPSHHFKDQAFVDYWKSSNDSDGETTPRPPSNIGFDAVTPGIFPDSYFPQHPDLSNKSTNSPDPEPSYFSFADRKILQRQASIWNQVAGHKPTMARRESLSEIRAANPDLSLSGNVISATFNIPHAFTYCKGGHWVSSDHTPRTKRTVCICNQIQMGQSGS